ncbi:hypothetical protein NMG60_11026376 [Bertholletia excelsa]
MEKKTTAKQDLPGFRFHPTEEELVNYYLKKTAFGRRTTLEIIGFCNIYLHKPSELPGLAKIGEREWYFFVARDRGRGYGGRPRRTTENGFWKATGNDRPIRCSSDPSKVLGYKKTLTDWIMNEYRLPSNRSMANYMEDIVLCKIYRKATPVRVLEQMAAMGEQSKITHEIITSVALGNSSRDIILKAAEEEDHKNQFLSPRRVGFGSKKSTTQIEVPKFSMDFDADPFWSQLKSQWLGNWSPYGG